VNNPFLAVLAGAILGGGFCLAFVDALATTPVQNSGVQRYLTQPRTIEALRSLQ